MNHLEKNFWDEKCNRCGTGCSLDFCHDCEMSGYVLKDGEVVLKPIETKDELPNNKNNINH
tara:strand:+ start:531 stop:713 length:183 start_codon:yes stop_codon:yes gene_type:complete